MKQKVDDFPEMHEVVAKRRRQRSLLIGQTEPRPPFADRQQLVQIGGVHWEILQP